MADIVDRLITRIELRGAENYLRSLLGIGRAVSSVAAAEARLNDLLNQSIPISNAARMAYLQEVAAAQEAAVAARAAARGPLLMIGAAIAASAVLASEKAQASFEIIEAQLTSTFGSRRVADQAIVWAERFGLSVGRSSEEVIQGMIRAKNEGIEPNIRVMRVLAGISDMTGEKMEQAANRLTRALSGEKRALQELGITVQGKSAQQIFAEVEQKVSRAARPGGIAGAWAQMTEQTKQAGRSIGEFFEPEAWAVVKVLQGLGDAISTVVNGMNLLIHAFQVGVAWVSKMTGFTTLLNKLFGGAVGDPLARALGWLNMSWDRLLGKGQLPTGDTIGNFPGGIGAGGGNLIRQILGFREFKGLAPSELPGMLRPGHGMDVNVHITPKDTLETMMMKVMEEVQRHGLKLQPG